ARTARSSAASTSPSTRRPQLGSSIKRPRNSRLSPSRESRSSAFKKATQGKSSSSAAECLSFWTELSSVRSEQVPAPLNKILRLQRRLSLHLVTSRSRPMHLVRGVRLPTNRRMRSAAKNSYRRAVRTTSQPTVPRSNYVKKSPDHRIKRLRHWSEQQEDR